MEITEEMTNQVRAYCYEEYYYFLDISLIFPIFGTKYWTIFFYSRFAICCVILIFGGSCFLYTSFLYVDDLGLFAFAFHSFLLGVIGFFIIVCSSYDQKAGVKFVHQFINEKKNYCAYADCPYDILLAERRHIIKKRLAIFWPVYYSIVLIVLLVIAPQIDRYLDMKLPPNEKDNGVAMTLPIPCWSPIDADYSWIAYISTYIAQLTYFAAIVIPTSGGTFFLIVNQLSLLDHLRLLTYSLGQLDERATHLYKQKYPGTKVDRFSKPYDDCYYHCLKENIKHHQIVYKCFYEYQAVVSLPLFIPFLGSSMLIALTGAHIISDDPAVAKKVDEFFLVVGEILLMITMCVLGEMLTLESENLRTAFFNTRWYNRSLRVKKAISVCMHMTVNPIAFKVGNIMTLNNSNLGAIMNSAYSTFNLFLAAQQKK